MHYTVFISKSRALLLLYLVSLLNEHAPAVRRSAARRKAAILRKVCEHVEHVVDLSRLDGLGR